MPQCILFQPRSCNQYKNILVNISDAAMVTAKTGDPVTNQEIRKVSKVPVIRHVTALAKDRILVSIVKSNITHKNTAILC